MNQDQSVDNDLQKAIDDITNTTNADPVFSNLTTPPSSTTTTTISENVAEEINESVGPLSDDTKVEMVQTPPEPIAPLESVNIPELNTPIPSTEPEKNDPPKDTDQNQTIEEPDSTEKLNAKQIKEAALRDLVPILGNIKMNPNQKFKIYRDIFEDLRDYSVLEPAYKAAKELPDETERAEALLYLVESIDKM